MATAKAATAKKASSNGHAKISKPPPWHIPLVGDEVAIVGFAPSSMRAAPFDDPNVEIWGINELYITVPRVTRLFELHRYKHFTDKQRNPKHLEWLQNATIPIYTLEKFKDIPNSIEFPYREVIKFAGTDYFTNTISWLIAFAVMEGARKISLYGIDMARSEEYEFQRPSVEYFIGWARGLGVEVYNPPESDILLSSHLYAIEEEADVRIRAKGNARKAELEQMIGRLQQEMANTKAKLDQAIGAHQEVIQWQKAYQPLLDSDWKQNHEGA